MGFSLGTGYAHPNSGDTVVSAMIGGMLTVQNGGFMVSTWDIIMWYWDVEKDYFDPSGKRINVLQLPQDPDAKRRKMMADRQNGNWPKEGVVGKSFIAYPKPFSLSDSNNHLMDKLRVFGKAVSNARPFDKVDILICTQSI
eukprot:3940804-Rhodomonas_salina.4